MTSPSPYPVKDFAYEVIDYLERRLRHQQIQPLWLGGEPGSAGSVTRPGGYIGLLPQNRVQYDAFEDEYSSGGSTLMDNLAHDRHRLSSYIRQLAAYVDSGGSICSAGSVANGQLPSWGSGAYIVAFSPGSPPGMYTVQDAIQYLYNEGSSGYYWHTITFTMEGNLSVNTGRQRFYAPGPMTIAEVFASVDTPPTGANIIVDVNKNATTIFTDQGKRPEIAAGSYIDTSGTPDVTDLVKNDYLTYDVDQVGSTIAGGYLTVHVRCKQYQQGD